MNTYYWTWPYIDATSRTDVLVEVTDRIPSDSIPEVITVTFWNSPDSAQTTFSTKGLIQIPEPAQ